MSVRENVVAELLKRFHIRTVYKLLYIYFTWAKSLLFIGQSDSIEDFKNVNRIICPKRQLIGVEKDV